MAAIHMQAAAPPPRPPMDRSASFDQTRSRSAQSYHSTSRSSSPAVRPQTYAHAASGSQSLSHSRTNSSASGSASSSPYVHSQPFGAPNYFPQPPPRPSLPSSMYSLPHSQSWSTTALPTNSFYPPPMLPPYGHQQVYPNYAQTPAEFAAWANAYHHMMAASMAASGDYANGQGMPPPPLTEFGGGGGAGGGGDRKRTHSGPSQSHGYNQHVLHQHHHPYDAQYDHHGMSHPSKSISGPSHVHGHGGPHPYKKNDIKPAKENIPTVPKSTSTPAFPTYPSRLSSDSSESFEHHHQQHHHHHRQSSMDSPSSSIHAQRPPIAPRKDSAHMDRSKLSTSPAPSVRSSTSPAPTIKAVTSNQQSQPLHSGPIANGTNTPQPTHASRPSPLSQHATAVAPTPASPPEKVKNGLKSRLKKALEKDAAASSKKSSSSSSSSSAAAAPSAITKQTHANSPSLNSNHSVTPPTTPPQASDLATPSAPFTVAHPQAMGSEISVAYTERTATGAPSFSELNQSGGKKRSLFRMRNMSTDNISLSSTVSSASMMIRKMGSLGKLARRNSLMGISKIFKDKPKDEDAALPEKEAKMSKKDKKAAKKAAAAAAVAGGKGQAAPVELSHATAEQDRFAAGLTEAEREEEDRVLAGLSPAAKLARQHTLRSKAEASEREAQRLSQISTTSSDVSGELAWDYNKANRNGGVLPPISSVTEESGPVYSPSGTIVRVASRQPPNLVHAVAVSEHEYDSADDSSDGETVEDVTLHLANARLSDGAADRAFREAWGNAWIDKNAVPRKGILKNALSSEDLEATARRQRSSSAADHTAHLTRGPMSSPNINADKIDGLDHTTRTEHLMTASPTPASPADSLSGSLSTGPDGQHFPYQNPAHNTSAPTLSLLGSSKPLVPRALTAPTPAKRRIIWAPACAVYSTYDSGTYDRRSGPATCNQLTPELAMQIKQELNAFKLEMPIHPASRDNTHYFA